MLAYDDLIHQARNIYSDACIEIRDDAPVAPEKSGALVQAWVWVPFPEEDNGGDE